MEKLFDGIKYKFFYDGIFSNWYLCKFTLDGIMFNSVEQYMMYKKALYFNDNNSAEKILKALRPETQKQIGRRVVGFNDKQWDLVKENIVTDAVYEKFDQNQKLKEYILKYYGYYIVEASPNDRVWGIGFWEDEAIDNINEWGENKLGKILTNLASYFYLKK